MPVEFTLLDTTLYKMYGNDIPPAKKDFYEIVVANNELLLTSNYKGEITTKAIEIQKKLNLIISVVL